MNVPKTLSSTKIWVLCAPKNFTKCAGKHTCFGISVLIKLQASKCNLIQKRLWNKFFSFQIYEIFCSTPSVNSSDEHQNTSSKRQNAFFTEHLHWLLLNTFQFSAAIKKNHPKKFQISQFRCFIWVCAWHTNMATLNPTLSLWHRSVDFNRFQQFGNFNGIGFQQFASYRSIHPKVFCKKVFP